MNLVGQRIVSRQWTSGWSSAEYLTETLSRLMIFRPGSSGHRNTGRVSTISLRGSFNIHLLVGEEDKCKLYCRVEYSSAYFLLASEVIDGTTCGLDTFDTCVGGQCVPAGCDHVLGSSAALGKRSGMATVLIMPLQTSAGYAVEMVLLVSAFTEH